MAETRFETRDAPLRVIGLLAGSLRRADRAGDRRLAAGLSETALGTSRRRRKQRSRNRACNRTRAATWTGFRAEAMRRASRLWLDRQGPGDRPPADRRGGAAGCRTRHSGLAGDRAMNALWGIVLALLLLAWQHGPAGARSALPPGSFSDLAFRQYPGAELPGTFGFGTSGAAQSFPGNCSPRAGRSCWRSIISAARRCAASFSATSPLLWRRSR